MQPNAPGWNAFFDAMLAELRNCSAATSENDRLVALNRLYKMWGALEVTPWPQGAALRGRVAQLAATAGQAGLGRTPAG